MTRRQKDPLRSLSVTEQQLLEQLSRARREPAIHVLRAQLLLAVSTGASYTEAARSIGRRSGDAVSQLVHRFNQEGLAALEPRHGGGAKMIYDSEKRHIIVQTVQRRPELDRDGTGHCSLSTLQRHLRAQPAFAQVSTYTLWRVLHEADWSWQSNRSWCQTGQVKRRRKSGIVTVSDPDSQAKKI